jgi:inner membrane protein
LASAFSHAIAALGIGACFYRPAAPRRLWLVGAAAGVLPDVDAVGYWLGVPYDSVWGHRGLTHSLLFAGAVATVGLVALRPVRGLTPRRLWSFLVLATASHGVLDAFTNGGLGVAFFAPLANGRYFFPVHPIEVSPISIRGFFTDRGWTILRSELFWIWLPSALLAGLAWGLRKGGRRTAGLG